MIKFTSTIEFEIIYEGTTEDLNDPNLRTAEEVSDSIVETIANEVVFTGGVCSYNVLATGREVDDK